MGFVVDSLRKSAKGQKCTLRLAGVCCDDSRHETTVLCHLAVGAKGIGMKSPDYMAVFGCHACHNVIDGRASAEFTGKDLLRAYAETLDIWLKSGLVNFGRGKS